MRGVHIDVEIVIVIIFGIMAGTVLHEGSGCSSHSGGVCGMGVHVGRVAVGYGVCFADALTTRTGTCWGAADCSSCASR